MATKAFLVAVSDYSKRENCQDLNGVEDLFAVSAALNIGLNIKKSDIRMLGIGRTVFLEDFHNMIDDIAKCDQEDIIFFYFSGHGDTDGNVYFSDKEENFNILIENFKKLPQKKVIVIDSCYSGVIQIEGETEFETNIIRINDNCALLASCRSYEHSGYYNDNDKDTISCFTHFFCDAVVNPGLVENGEKTIDDIARYISHLSEGWNKNHGIGKQQHPVYRSTLSGTIRFSVGEFSPYKKKTYTYDGDEYSVCSVEPWHTCDKMRYRVNVILKDKKPYSEVSRIASEIVKNTRQVNVFNSEFEEQCLSDEHVKEIKCVFGYDTADLKFATWAFTATWLEGNAELEIKEEKKYDYYKSLRSTGMTKEEFTSQTESLFNDIVKQAKEYIRIYRETKNGTINDLKGRELLFPISITINDLSFKLGMLPACFEDLQEWFEKRFTIVQDVLEMALPYKGYTFEKWYEPERDQIIQDAIRKFHDGIDSLPEDN